MEKKAAISLIAQTFNQRFDIEKYTLFLRNLLNDYDESKERDWAQSNHIYEAYKEHIQRFKRLGVYTDPQGNEMELLVIETKATDKLERARTSLRNFVIKRLGDKNRDYALAAFYSKEDGGADWRFSFIKVEHESYKDQKGKVKTRKELTPAKRYSFLVGEHEHAYTAQKQLLPVLQNDYSKPDAEDLEACFSIEKVTDEFFEQYKELYLKLSEYFDSKRAVQTILKANDLESSRFTKKLLGQIVFLYFLQKKGWLGVPKDEAWGNGDKKFVQSLYDEAIDKKQNFFKDYLQPLFYEALAKPRVNSADPAYYKRFDCKIPFLNGGLFEADYNWQEANLSIPNDIFRNEEKNKAGDKGTGILDVFDRYNFTIKEDEPLEKEVAVDPEMLGKVFENMLEITERKSKGAYYTPREVVHYMCQESLINYLNNAIKDAPPADIETFIRKGFIATENDQLILEKGKETSSYKFQLPESIRQQADELDKQLTDIKICDPAIGSGAFPVGLMHELVMAQKVLLPYLSEAYLEKKLKAIDLKKATFKKDPSKYIYRVKRHAIQESIYGVDIDASAIDIARLRLWLSLVVDEDDFYSIETLPNLDYKIVRGNSLIGLPGNAMKDVKAEKELEELKEQFFNETNEKDKKALRSKINKKIREVLDSAEQFVSYKIEFDFKLYFSEVWREKNGFDIVIGNPPYVDIKQLRPEFVRFLFDNYSSAENRINLYSSFIEKGLKLCSPDGALIFINPNSMLLNSSYKKLRRLIIEKLIQVIKLPDHIFKEAIVETIIIQIGNYNNRSAVLGAYYKKDDPIAFDRLDFREFSIQSFLKDAEIRINIFCTPELLNVLSKIESKGKPLQFYTDFCLGITPYDKYKGHTEEQINNRVFHADRKKSKEYVPLIAGGNINRFYVDPSQIEEYLRYGDWLGAPRQRKFFTEPRVIVRQIVSGKPLKIYAGYTDAELYHTQIGFAILAKPDAEISIKSLGACLNSDVINFYHKYKYLDIEKNTFQKILIENCKNFPVTQHLKEHDALASKILDYNNILSAGVEHKPATSFFDELNNALFFELYFPEAIKAAGKEVIRHLGNLQPLTPDMPEEKKLAIIQSEFERLYDPNHPVRNAIESLDSVKEVRLIKEALN